MRRAPLGLAAVVALLAGGTAAVTSVGTPGGPAGAQQVEVLGATAVCPDVHQIPGLFQTRISVGAAPLPAGRTSSGGSVTTSLVSSHAAPVGVPLAGPGQVAVGLGTNVSNEGVVLQATRALATGLEVEQVDRVNDGRHRGLANVRCEAPRRDAWFVGSSATLVDRTDLILANIDDTPATVDVTVFGRTAAYDPRPGAGLTVAPHRRLYVPIDSLAPDGAFLVVHVTSRQGRVVSTLRTSRFAFGEPKGFDYVPRALPPAQQVVVPGVPGDQANRYLVIGNPADDDTTVSIRVTLRDDQFVPAGL